MTATPTRTLRELIDEGKVQPAPMQATDAQLREMDRQAEPLTVQAVDMEDTDSFGIHWTLTVERPTGERLLIGFWSNPQRDDTLSGLMQAMPDGPIAGVKLINAGTTAKPFWLIDAA